MQLLAEITMKMSLKGTEIGFVQNEATGSASFTSMHANGKMIDSNW